MRANKALDLSSQSTGLPPDGLANPRKAWSRAGLAPEDWTFRFTPEALAEVEAIVAALRKDPLPTLLLTPEQFELPACRELMGRVRALLVEGIGFCVVDGLPLERYSEEEAKAAYWVLGLLVGRTVAQKWDGTMLYDVTDTGRALGYGVRASWTDAELVFHTDNCFSAAMPEIVSLLCFSPAASGGISRFCSIHTILERLRERHPKLLQRLYRPFYYDRQAEHAPDAPKVTYAPALAWEDGRLHGRLNNNLIRKGHELAGQPLDAEGAEALAALEEVMADEELWVELRMERGQLQLLNNLEFVHYRSAFTDDERHKRHLVRLWIRDRGRRGFDG